MIVELTIQNFRSIRDEVILSFYVENPKQHLSSHVAYPANDKFGILRSIGIYGANASGKSNVLMAFEALRYISVGSGDAKEGDAVPCYEPYLLSPSSKTAPVLFELEFFNEQNIRYLYRVSFDQYAINEESLDFYPNGVKANIFNRTSEDTWETISFGGLYKGGTKRIPFFKNNSYLSKAGENAAAPEMIRSAYKCLRSSVHHLNVDERVLSRNLHKDEDMLKKISSILCQVDTGITDVQVKINEQPEIPSDFLEQIPERAREIIWLQHSRSFVFAHTTETGDCELFKEKLESEGTRKLFSILPLLIDVFNSGGVLIVDELDASLHPHIAELIIKLFNDSKVNTNNAQLLFSTHNIQLMDSQKLRRDQIWFTQKHEGVTLAYSLSEFDKNKIKSNSPFGHWYDQGRFGAIPQINYKVIADALTPPQS